MNRTGLPFQAMIPAKAIVDHICREREESSDMYTNKVAYWAVQNQRKDVLEELLRRSVIAGKDTSFEALSSYALHNDSADIVAFFLANGLRSTSTCLFYCIQTNAVKCFLLFLNAVESLTDSEAYTLALEACRQGRTAMLTGIITRQMQHTTPQRFQRMLFPLLEVPHKDLATKNWLEALLMGRRAVEGAPEPEDGRRPRRARKPPQRLLVDHGSGAQYRYEGSS